jgi:uncharacterized protein (DUF433 family)
MMPSENQVLEAKIDEALTRIERLEQQREEGVSPWVYLVARPHPWRRQLSIKGRNMTVGQLLASMRANQLAPEQASMDFELPLAAVHEALAYEKQNPSLIDLEFFEERRRVAERGHALEPAHLPR